MAKSIQSLYCFSSIPQPGATVYFYDFQKNKDDGLKYSLKDIINWSDDIEKVSISDLQNILLKTFDLNKSVTGYLLPIEK